MGRAGITVLLGGFGNDIFHGSLAEDVMVGEYARVTLVNGVVVSLVTLGQGKLDIIANRQANLYTHHVNILAPVVIPDEVQDC